MLSFFAYIVAAGFLVRADGWGASSIYWKRVSDLFNVWSCSALFALFSALYFGIPVGVTCGVAFLIFRLPGFPAWESWGGMFIRGLWTSAIGFALIGGWRHEYPFLFLMSAPFAALYASVYAFGHTKLPQTILGFNRHVWIEHASGWLFAAFILGGL